MARRGPLPTGRKDVRAPATRCAVHEPLCTGRPTVQSAVIRQALSATEPSVCARALDVAGCERERPPTSLTGAALGETARALCRAPAIHSSCRTPLDLMHG